MPLPGLKAKDLVGIPWRVAFALQADGWYLRSDIIEEVELYCPCGCGYRLEERIWRYSQDRDIIWRKPNPMPESVKDRPTKAHEYLFLLSKAERYHYDAAAIAEQGTYTGPPRRSDSFARGCDEGQPSWQPKQHRPGREDIAYSGTRNRRSAWTIATAPFPEAHFATFPEELVKPCIMAGCPAEGIVLDPFMGAGTTALVATALGRQWLGCELNPEYVAIAKRRLHNEVGLLLEATE